MSDHPVGLHRGGPPETVLPSEPPEILAALARAAAEPDLDARRVELRAIAARRPRCVGVWARLGDSARDQIEAYAYYRVGYHRGLDQLRQSGWRGSGYVRGSQPENQGFLSALDGLRRAAESIGEADEAARCAEFLVQLDPSGYGTPQE